MHLQVQGSRAMNGILPGRSSIVSRMVSKRNQLKRWPESFRRTRAEAQLRVQSGQKVRGYSCSMTRSMSPMTEIFGIVLSNSTTIHTSPNMQAALIPLSWYHTIIGGHKCPITLAPTLSTVICATRLKYNIDDPSVSSIPQRLLKHHGMWSVLTSLLRCLNPMVMTQLWMSLMA
jgi:hypothetical protein